MEAQPEVEIVRSARRRSSLSATMVEGRVVVRVPAHLSKKELDTLVPRLVQRVLAKQRPAARSDGELLARSLVLSKRYLGGLARPAGVRWVSNQQRRWGSCTPSTRQIRLSERLSGMPQYVIDYVLVHELAHLLQPDHGSGFKALMAGYPHAERAQAFLDGVSFGSGLPPIPMDDLGEADPAPA
ncbi:M48 family metallopeptidase [Yimella sp. cx-573]|nr:M48 family metallopeptidase [Yimella sp. cx-573]